MKRVAGAALCAAMALGAVPALSLAARLPRLGARAAAPSLSANAAILIEASTGQRLYGASPDERLPIASTTKLMTALVTLEHVRLGRVFAQEPGFYPAAVDSKIGLVPGERMSVHDLLLALLLPSADDAAEDLAFNVGRGSVGRFIGMMNARARELRLVHTHYSTPIGLDTPGNYSSASDLVKLADFILAHHPFFAHAVALPAARLVTGNYQRVVLNRNDLVGRVPWINGVKTGHTLDAGYVLVGSGTRHGMTLLSAVLGTPSQSARDSDTLALLDYGFASFRVATPIVAGSILASPAVRDRPGVHAEVIAGSTFRRVIRRRAHLVIRLDLPHQLTGPLKLHAVVGRAIVLANGRAIASVPLLLAHALAAVSPLTLAARFLTRPSTLLSLVALLGASIGLAGVRRARARGRDVARLEAA